MQVTRYSKNSESSFSTPSSSSQQFYIAAPAAPPDDRTRVLKYGTLFAVFDRYGDIEPIGLAEEGVFCDGTRFLSNLVLLIGGARPLLLSSTVREDNATLTADFTNVDISQDGQVVIRRGTLLVSRLKFLWGGMCFEQIKISNYGLQPITTCLELQFDADFADIFEVRGVARRKRGNILEPSVNHDTVQLSYEGLDRVTRSTRLHFAPAPASISATRCRFDVSLPPQKETVLELTVSCSYESRRREMIPLQQALLKITEEMHAPDETACEIYSSNQQFNDWMRRSLADLQMMTVGNPEVNYPYAGVPWFSTAFGRDGIITALECLWLRPSIARGVLQYLATTQATEFNPAFDAEPGKILHESRRGEMAALGEVPFGRYYGSIDATPLFVMLADAYHRRTGDTAFVEHLWPHLELALNWIDEYGDIDGDGFVEYCRRSEKGLVQQGWKDSSDSVFHRDGSIAEPPIALCEVQGYVYSAKLAGANIARTLGRLQKAQELKAQAQQLKARFREFFWSPELSTFVVALDGKKRQCRIRTSNAGHCLFTGIADADHAQLIAQSLLSSDFFSGWGIRTVASGEVRYNPISYHNGSVWPHDNAIIAAGLAKYGFKTWAAQIVSGFQDVSQFVELHRLPELFCGLPRRPGESPTLYPVACSPQAWSAASIFMFLEACLGIAIQGEDEQVTFSAPCLPRGVSQLWIRNLRVLSHRVDLLLERSGETVKVISLNKQKEVRVAIR